MRVLSLQNALGLGPIRRYLCHASLRANLAFSRPFSAQSNVDDTKPPKPKQKKKKKISFMYPQLHPDIVKAVAGVLHPRWIEASNSKEAFTKEYSTNIMGRFRCVNDACSKAGWGSGTVSIVIKGYPSNGYNAVVFNQRCRSCEQLGTLRLDQNSYVERVSYRLKKWAGSPVTPPPFVEKLTDPHERDLCEGCKHGYCLEGRVGTGRWSD